MTALRRESASPCGDGIIVALSSATRETRGPLCESQLEVIVEPSGAPRNEPASPTRLARLTGIAAITVCVLASLVILSGIVTSTPAACRSCHASALPAAGDAHARVSCAKCHVHDAASWLELRTAQAIRMPIAYVAKGSPNPSHGKLVSNKSCGSCHRGDEMDSVVGRNGLRMAHTLCLRSWDRCADCHGDVGHIPSPANRHADMNACLGCHDVKGDPEACDICHVGERPLDLAKSGPWAAVHLDTNGKTHGMGDLDSCLSCHPAAKCEGCHGVELPHPKGFPRTHGLAAKGAAKSCQTCHDPTVCDNCHGIKMPHPAGFLKTHLTTTKGMSDPACMKCHRQQDCDRCHVEHTHPGSANSYKGSYW